MKILKCLRCAAAVVIVKQSNREEVGPCPYCGATKLEEL